MTAISVKGVMMALGVADEDLLCLIKINQNYIRWRGALGKK